jgi:predicted phage tail protein
MVNTLTFRIPGLPGEDGRVTWRGVAVEHVHGRTLARYIAGDLAIEAHQVSHVIVDGRVIDPEMMVAVPVPESKWQRRWRTLRRKPVPTVEVSTFDAYIPRAGEEIFVVPNVDGKNAGPILGAIGLIVVGVAGYMVGGPGGAMAALKAYGSTAFMVGSLVGSTIAALTTPRPRPIKDQDGPSSYVWNGLHNDDRAGVPKPILLGERLVGGKRIGMVRRAGYTVPVRPNAASHNDSSPSSASEKLEILLLIAAHECEGPVGVTTPNSAANTTTNKPDVRINGQHYSNFPGVQVDWRTGAAGQSVMRGFDVVANTVDLSVDLTDLGAGVAYTYTTVGEVDAFEVILALPGLSHTNDEGGLKSNTTRYKLEYRKVGDPDWENADAYNPGDGNGACRRLTANTRALRHETRRIATLEDGTTDLPRGRYEIKLQWLSAEHTNLDRDQWHIVLTGVTEEIQESRNYEGDSLLAVRALATDQLSGPIPTITSLWRGAKPQKYTTAGGFAAASWGVGQTAPAGKNPIWLSLWLMRNTDIGAGDQIADTDIDLASFEAACDPLDGPDALETVEPADGSASYTEPRHQFAAYIDQDQEAIDLIQQILSTARGVLIFTGNKWRVAVDKPGSISQVFGMGSILVSGDGPDAESTFNLQFKSERHEVNCFEATFDDSAADWETESHSEFIDNRDPDDGGGTFITGDDPEDQLADLGLPILRRRLSFWGVDRRTQVARELRFALRQAYALREFGSFGASTKAILSEVYDLIGISHDVPQWGYSGRVPEAAPITGITPSASMVLLDQVVPIETGDTYQLMIHFREEGPDGKDFIETRTVADAPNPNLQFYALTVTSPFSRVPQPGDEWFFGLVDRVVRPARIVDIDRDADDQRVIAFAEYNASIYDVSGPIVIPNYSLLPDFSALPGAITNLVAKQIVSQREDGRRVVSVYLHWDRPAPKRTEGPYKGARVDYSFDGENWTPRQSVDGIEYLWEDPPPGHVYFRVVPYSIAGKYNFDGAAEADLEIEGYEGALPAVQNIAGGQADGAFWVSWDALGPEYEYEVRSSNPGDWSASTTGFLWRGKTTRFLDELPSARSITYYVRARDGFGNYSTAANSVSLSDTAPAAPTITTITQYEDGFKIKVTPPGGVTDIVAIHLHASQSPGFTPSYSNRVGQPVGPNGGEFFFKTTVTGTWYFAATCEDWLSQRMNDWLYTSESDDTIIVIAPVNPSGVVCTLNADELPDFEPPENGTSAVRTRYSADVTWVHNDSVNDPSALKGWEVVLYNPSAGVGTPISSVVLHDSSLRAITLRNLFNAPSITQAVAAVKALYQGGLTSDFVTSTNQTIPQSTNPRLRTSDDRQVVAYSDSFDGTSLPTGFSVINGSTSFATAGELAITMSSSLVALRWDIIDWISAYVDPSSKRSGPAIAIIRMKVPANVTGTEALTIASTNGGVATLDVIADGAWHSYRVAIGNIPSPLITYQVQFELTAPVGTVWRITSAAIAFEGYDTSIDAYVGRGILARQQFERDEDGDGLAMIAPVRLGDADGNYTVVQENGLYFLRDENGELAVETPYKLGRTGRIAQYLNNVPIHFGDSDWGLSVPIPQPVAYNKLRMIIQDVGSDFIPSDVPASTTVRRWLEACSFGDHSGQPGFVIYGMFFYGGTLRMHTASGSWPSSDDSKSSLSLGSDSVSTSASSDAWYYVQDDAGLPLSDVSPFAWYFRVVVFIAVEMPVSKRSNGSFHYVDLEFTVRVGEATKDGTKMNLGSNYTTNGPFKTRLLADGRTTLIPIVCGPSGAPTLPAAMSRDDQNVKVDWHSQTWEEGGSGTVLCEVDSINWSYIDGCTGRSEISLADLGFSWFEEFGG